MLELEPDRAVGEGGGEHGIRVGDVVRVGAQPRGGERRRDRDKERGGVGVEGRGGVGVEGRGGVEGVVVKVGLRGGVQVAVGVGGKDEGEVGVGEEMGGRLWV